MFLCGISTKNRRVSLMGVSYIGSGEYCYANSLSTVLQYAGEQFGPEYLECLTCVGNSAFMAADIPFFSSYFNAPDAGINRALTILGYTFKHTYSRDTDPSTAETRLNELKQALTKGPVVVGPMEMSRLVYNPNHNFLRGADHYMTVIEDKGDFLRVHDPKGFPFALLDVPNFLSAWKAETIDYRIGSYSMWADIKRVSEPSSVEIFNLTNREIVSILRKERDLNDKHIGVGAIHTLAEHARQKSLAPHVLAHLTQFALPLGARRASDYYKFYKSYDEKKAALKYHLAKLFGTALSSLMLFSQESVADILLELADVEMHYQELALMK